MRRAMQGRSGLAIAFVVGLAVASAGTATAAKLITGKQIKDGSIASKDLDRSVRQKLAQKGATGATGSPGAPGVGVPGPAGAKGEKGEPGPLLTVLPTGTTQRGSFRAAALSEIGVTEVSLAVGSISFPTPMAGSPAPHLLAVGAQPTNECAGNVSNPTAALGHLCVYLGQLSNASSTSIVNPENGVADQASRFGAAVTATRNASPATTAVIAISGTWAVAAG